MIKIRMPINFLLKGDYLNDSIKFLSELTKLKNKKIALILYDLINLTQSEVIVLAAQMEKAIQFKSNQVFIDGGLPKNRKIKEMFLKSVGGWHVNRPISVSEATDLEKEKTIPPGIIDDIVKDLKKIGFKEHFIPFNEFLTELIGNAAEHGVENKNINWWMHHHIDRKKRIATYTFVDMGTGIINSHKKAGIHWKYFFLNDRKIVLDALYGKLGSSTKMKNRGRGLPQLRDTIEKELVSNVVLITNTVNLCFENGKFIANTNADFVGTYFSWTINEKNYQKWMESR